MLIFVLYVVEVFAFVFMYSKLPIAFYIFLIFGTFAFGESVNFFKNLNS